MRKPSKNQLGFGVFYVVVAIVVVIGLGVAGWYVYQRVHDTKSQAPLSGQAAKSTQQANQLQPDPYTGWKTYCDSTYGYCFMYPSTWVIIGGSGSASSVGSTGGINLLSPTKTVQVVYSNAYTPDSRLTNFYPTKVEKLNQANQDLVLIGGYTPSEGSNGLAGNNIPSYRDIDSKLLDIYPLRLDQVSQFPSASRFTDKRSGYYGALLARPAITIDTIAQSEAWLNSSDAKTSVKILESLYYKG